MKKLFVITLGLILLLLLSANVQSGRRIGSNGNWPGVAPPHSNSHGKSLDDWMHAYMRWWANGADPSETSGNVAFLPIWPGPEFEVEIKVGTALVLPVTSYLGFEGDDTLPDEWFGDPDFIYGWVNLNGALLVELNEDYYVGPTYLIPPAVIDLSPFGVFPIAFYQSLLCLILPLPPGEHELVLHSYFEDGTVFDNTWYITVVTGNGRN